jgi:serine/threonine protein kinase
MEAHGYERLQLIGRGSQGHVYKCRRVGAEQLSVAKVIPFSAAEGGSGDTRRHETAGGTREKALKESALLSSLRHPNIVLHHESFLLASVPGLSEPDSLCVIMALCEGGDLHQAIQRRAQSGTHFGEGQVLWWLVQLALALRYMHDRHLLHRDVKSSNIFLRAGGPSFRTSGSILQFGDFGMARTLKNSMELARTCVGTPSFMSPEVVRGSPYGAKTDVWGLGCVMYQVSALKNAFAESTLNRTMQRILASDYAPLPAREEAVSHPTNHKRIPVSFIDRLTEPPLNDGRRTQKY